MNINEFCGVDSLDRFPNGTELSHREKYSKVVNAIGLHNVVAYIPATLEELTKKLKQDEYLNNIDLPKWDGSAEYPHFRRLLQGIGINVYSLADRVCILKQAARMWVEQQGA